MWSEEAFFQRCRHEADTNDKRNIKDDKTTTLVCGKDKEIT
jgi:hypothetical protein